MKRVLLSLLAVFSMISAFAQDVPAITLKAEVDGNTRSLEVALSVEGTVKVDWGDGTLVESENIPVFDGWNQVSISGVVKGEGTVKVYGDNIVYFGCASRVDDAQILALDVTNAPALQQLYANANKLTTLDLTKNVELTKVDVQNNQLTSIDVSKNMNLTSLTLSKNLLSSIDISHNQKLQTLYLSENKFEGTLDLSSNPNLKSLYCLDNAITSVNLGDNVAEKPYFSFNNNKLTSFDVSKLTKLSNGTLFLIGNQLTEIIMPADGIKTLNISNNNFALAALPQFTSARYTYAPQADYAVAESFNVNDELDLSSQTDATLNTTFAVLNGTGEALVEGTDYTVTDGKIKFLTAQEAAYVTMTSTFFPKFTGSNIYKTTTFAVKGTDTGISNVETTNVNVCASVNGLTVSGLSTGDEVRVYSLGGAVVAQQKAVAASMNIPATSGVYVVKVNGKTFKVGK